MIRKLSVIALVAGAAFVGEAAVAAPLSDAQVIQQARDRIEIEDLLWTYTRALDSGDADAYVATYTEDGSFGNTKGHAALKNMVNAVVKDQADRRAKGEKIPQMYHMTTNHKIQFIGKDRARIELYWMTSFSFPGEPTGGMPGVEKATKPWAPAFGRGVDELVRVNGRWLIKSRDVSFKD